MLSIGGAVLQKKVLIVDDEKNIVDIIAFNLKKEGFQVIKAGDGEEGLKKTFEQQPDIILLDIMMPKMDGYETCKKIREKLQTPIIMLTARAEEVDKVLGLELGADDYVTKPFGIRELVARVKANLRRLEALEKRSTAVIGNQQQYGRIVINLDRYEVQKDGTVIDLTYREFEHSKRDKFFQERHCLKKYGDMNILEMYEL